MLGPLMRSFNALILVPRLLCMVLEKCLEMVQKKRNVEKKWKKLGGGNIEGGEGDTALLE